MDGFPPHQHPPLQDIVLHGLVNAWGNADGVDIPWGPALTQEQRERLVDWMHGVVKDLA